MKPIILALGILLCLGLLACSDDDTTAPTTPSTPTTATFVFAQRMANADLKVAAAVDPVEPRAGRIIDTRHARLKVEIAQGDIADGEADTCDWILIYDSHEEMRDSERVFAPVSVPVGRYNSLRITTDSDHVVWECDFDGETIDLHAQTSPVAVFGDGGLFLYIDGTSVLESVAPGERLGGFDVLPDVTTHLTIVSNLDSLFWHDDDASGDWTDGDSISGVTGVAGTTTMADFVADYVD